MISISQEFWITRAWRTRPPFLARWHAQSLQGTQMKGEERAPTQRLSFSSTGFLAPGCLHITCLGSPERREQTEVRQGRERAYYQSRH